MSAASDSFVDHYEILQISPNAHSETIQRVYRLLAQMYHPDNKETGDQELFEQVLQAYKILGDPERRAAYDVEHRVVSKLKWKIFDQPSATIGLEGEKRKRFGILSILCTKRMNQPDQPALNIVEMEQLLGCPREHLEMSLWYLRESGRIQRSDNGKYALSVKGLETLEQSGSDDDPLSNLRLLNAPHESSRPSESA